MVHLSWYHGLVLHVLQSKSALTAGGICRITNARAEDVEHALCDLVAAELLVIVPGIATLTCFVVKQGILQTGNLDPQAGCHRPIAQSVNPVRARLPRTLRRTAGQRIRKRRR